MANKANKTEAKAKVEEIFEEVKEQSKTETTKKFETLKELKKRNKKRTGGALTGLLVLGIIIVAAAAAFLAKDSESWFSKIAKAIIGQGNYTISIGCFQFSSSWSADPQKKSWGFSFQKK